MPDGSGNASAILLEIFAEYRFSISEYRQNQRIAGA